ncbi:type II secretion system protein [Desertifilum sp. FACHB-1129]|uniref:Prepilin-type N-terminal cleavage/methylation domain-containing protein n=2 Tax=Desertifilum tharense IPPAS B-1220 TaxID=1781255 RepID=A0A1E5QD85_9CYAN|nr:MULTISPECIES: hormogonium polysaccharide secretion pseudopilin HpsC [Desertifilum]MDA0212344.1 hormogonium polysaccharide secretion pseudopilin HpsC [Cyanobacteria bacterium FC1]MBD2311325.1 type II secretion system protein [Desertifilum sp. FACHB-1129]MBD2321571.1 type II secretion system protein [Desertifilum sp. FACHB-866]MBD2331698.1 type II secretion system protein [Desertifilum sp. FACHB-868]OEJ72626.1 hypothetical protein BH720_24315 [Desertifilum tharense IPPAS B-1220]
MKRFLKALLRRQVEQIKQFHKTNGFTMIELLVALVIATIMVSALLGFVVDILNSDRREQAKAISEQEIQAALDYIARDLEQAIFIYDADGIYGGGTSPSPTLTGILSQIPGFTNTANTQQRVPVLVFWKRTFLARDQSFPIPNAPNRRIGQLALFPNLQFTEQDYQVYSLVVYYQMRDNPGTCTNSTWSCTSRIGRLELRGGVPQPFIPGYTSPIRRVEGTPPVDIEYALPPSPGFMPFNPSADGRTLREKMDKWRKHPTEVINESQLLTLVDYIDQTPFDRSVLAGTAPTVAPAPQRCSDQEQMVPRYSSLPPNFNDFPGSFYACIRYDPSNPGAEANNRVATVFLRGNALARISSKTSPPEYSERQSAFFPTNSMRIETRGNLTLVE